MKKLIIILCILLCFISIAINIIAIDKHHLENCHEHDCSRCTLIQIAINLSKNFKLIMINVILINIIFNLTYKIKAEINSIINNTLISCKIQFNE